MAYRGLVWGLALLGLMAVAWLPAQGAPGLQASPTATPSPPPAATATPQRPTLTPTATPRPPAATPTPTPPKPTPTPTATPPPPTATPTQAPTATPTPIVGTLVFVPRHRAAAPTPAPGGSGIVGRVVDLQGKGLPGIRLRLWVGQFGLGAETTADGSYTFGNLAPGTYSLRVEGYPSETAQDIVVESQRLTVVDFAQIVVPFATPTSIPTSTPTATPTKTPSPTPSPPPALTVEPLPPVVGTPASPALLPPGSLVVPTPRAPARPFLPMPQLGPLGRWLELVLWGAAGGGLFILLSVLWVLFRR